MDVHWMGFQLQEAYPTGLLAIWIENKVVDIPYPEKKEVTPMNRHLKLNERTPTDCEIAGMVSYRDVTDSGLSLHSPIE